MLTTRGLSSPRTTRNSQEALAWAHLARGAGLCPVQEQQSRYLPQSYYTFYYSSTHILCDGSHILCEYYTLYSTFSVRSSDQGIVRCLLGRPSQPSSSLTTTSTLTNASDGMGGTVPSSLTNVRGGMGGTLSSSLRLPGAGRHALTLPRRRAFRCRPSLRRSRDAQGRLLGCGEAAQAHSLATAPHTRLVRLGPAGPVADAEVACLALGHEQRQFLRLRLLPRPLARQRRRRCSPLRRHCLPLRRTRHAQRRLLGGGEVAQVHTCWPPRFTRA